MNSTWIKDLAGAWVFYTVLPGSKYIEPSFKRIARFAPIIGFLIGLVQGSCWLLFVHMGWPKEAVALLVIAIGIWITGGLHLDGLMDTSDGLAAEEERCSEAMKDSRVGASAVNALTLIVLIQLAALIKLDALSPLAIPIAAFWSRCSPLWAIENFPYLHNNGTRSIHQANWKRWREFKPALIMLGLIFFTLQCIPINEIYRFQVIIGLCIGFLPAIVVPELLGRKLGGHSGDSYGACLVFVETSMLLILAMIW